MTEHSTPMRLGIDPPPIPITASPVTSPSILSTSSSPPQTATPSSFASDDGASPDITTAKRLPSVLPTTVDSPNARSKSVTHADGDDTYGVLNRHPAVLPSTHSDRSTLRGAFRVGVSEDRNKRCRRTMEDAHSFVYDYAGVRGQGYFAVFDGHAGKHAAEWCGQNFHEYLLDALLSSPNEPVPDILNKTFHAVDARLSHLAYKAKTHSGCTAVTAFLRVEKDIETLPCGFTNPALSARGLLEGRGEDELEAQTSQNPSSRRSSMGGGSAGFMGGAATPSTDGSLRRKMSGRRIRDFVRGLTSSGRVDDSAIDDDSTDEHIEAIEPKSEHGIRKVLYTANVGDARAVLCRGGKAVRLTYDHKGSDSQEAKRITDAGGFVMNNRVNGVLAVTRSLGDASMKEFVVGSPYTTETVLDEEDEFLIVACDGLWDVCEDQDAVDLIRNVSDPQEASKRLLEHALGNYSTDNLSIMVVRFFDKSE
ncbi:Protein phosphatase 2C 1 [Vanrija pseudolonga]|uniref:Protein phosphatase 2C 1 n=1 Tax=Vanrija pseudolonga TaxID=143232 RepID=A0AAF0YCN3_9TREE|nr:Protein phosphatase 2C 1 [Vanrija pseudolonga]